MEITGSCFCGTVSYVVTDRLKDARSCHCSRCRKAFSGASSAYAIVQSDSHHWTSGEAFLKYYKATDEWALVFCSKCGSTLAGVFNDSVHGVTLGTLDGDPKVDIDYHIFVGSKAPWDHIGGCAPQYAEGVAD